MKTFILLIALIAFVPSLQDSTARHQAHLNRMREILKNCISKNENASESLKKAFTEDSSTISSYREALGNIKDKLSTSDKEILKECRKETFKVLREERLKEVEERQERLKQGHKLTKRPSLRTMEEKQVKEKKSHSKVKEIRKQIVACIEESADATDNLKNLVKEDTNLKSLLRSSKNNNLSEEELKVVRECRRSVFEKTFYAHRNKNGRKLTKKRDILKKRPRVPSKKKVTKAK